MSPPTNVAIGRLEQGRHGSTSCRRHLRTTTGSVYSDDVEMLRGTWVCVLLACGAPSPMTPSASSPTGAHTAAAFPRLRLVVHNFAADEGETWTFDVRTDGSFAAEGWMSNGGEDHTAWRCEGEIEAALAGTGLGRPG